jgi:CheY-like chemotaxis protein
VPKEKRKAARGQVSATVVLLEGDHQLGSFRVLNLSAGGALLVGRAPRNKRGELDVLIRMSTGRTVRAAAVVVREESVDESSVFALEFVRVSPEDHDAIDNLLLTAVEDERDPTALIVAHAPEIRHLLRSQLNGLGHPSFAVGNLEDATRFLETPNIVEVALVDLGLNAGGAAKVLAYLADKHPDIRRIAITSDGATSTTRRASPLAQRSIVSPWTREGLARVLDN